MSAVPVLGLIVGAILVIAGWPRRGRFGVVCARCETLLPEPIGESCPACALDFRFVGTRRTGMIHDERRLRRSGVVVLVLAWCVLAWQITAPPFRTIIPEWVLVVGDGIHADLGARPELTRRAFHGTLSESAATTVMAHVLPRLHASDDQAVELQLFNALLRHLDAHDPAFRPVLDELLARHGDRAAPWHIAESAVIEHAYRDGAVTREEWATYCRNLIAPRVVLAVSEPLSPGQHVSVHLDAAPRAWQPGGRPMSYGISVRGLAPAIPLTAETRRRDGNALTEFRRRRGERVGNANGEDLGHVPLGVLIVPDRSGETVTISGSIAVYFDVLTPFFERMPGFDSGDPDLTELADAPVTATFSQTFAIAPRAGSDAATRSPIDQVVDAMRHGTELADPIRWSPDQITGRILLPRLPQPARVRFDVDLRFATGEVISMEGAILEQSRTQTTVHTARMTVGSYGVERGELSLSLENTASPHERIIDLVITVREVTLFDAERTSRELDEEIVMTGVRMR